MPPGLSRNDFAGEGHHPFLCSSPRVIRKFLLFDLAVRLSRDGVRQLELIAGAIWATCYFGTNVEGERGCNVEDGSALNLIADRD